MYRTRQREATTYLQSIVVEAALSIALWCFIVVVMFGVLFQLST